MIRREQQIVEVMIRLYCRRKEGNAELCDECRALLAYARERLDRCPHGDRKPACRRCPNHCYRPAMRDKIRHVMRFSGPRMLFYCPWTTLRHLF